MLRIFANFLISHSSGYFSCGTIFAFLMCAGDVESRVACDRVIKSRSSILDGHLRWGGGGTSCISTRR